LRRRRRIRETRLSGPAGVGLRGKDLHAALAHDVGTLLLQRRGHGSGVPQPLVPGRRDGHLAVVGAGRALDDAALAACLGAAGVAELPERVAV
jgi:hypothetical protein